MGTSKSNSAYSAASTPSKKKRELSFNWGQALSGIGQSLSANSFRDGSGGGIVFTSEQSGDVEKDNSPAGTNSPQYNFAALQSSIKHPCQMREKTPFKRTARPHGITRNGPEHDKTAAARPRKASSLPCGSTSHRDYSHSQSIKETTALERLGLTNVSLPSATTSGRREKVVKATHGCKISLDPNNKGQLKVNLDSKSETIKLNKGCRVWCEDGDLVMAFESSDKQPLNSTITEMEENDDTHCSELEQSPHEDRATETATPSKAATLSPVCSAVGLGRNSRSTASQSLKTPPIQEENDLSLSMNCSSYTAPSNAVSNKEDNGPVTYNTVSIQCDVAKEMMTGNLAEETVCECEPSQTSNYYVECNRHKFNPSCHDTSHHDTSSCNTIRSDSSHRNARGLPGTPPVQDGQRSITESATGTGSLNQQMSIIEQKSASTSHNGREVEALSREGSLETVHSEDVSQSSVEEEENECYKTPLQDTLYYSASAPSFSQATHTEQYTNHTETSQTAMTNRQSSEDATSSSSIAGKKRKADKISNSTDVTLRSEESSVHYEAGPTRMKLRVYQNANGEPIYEMTFKFTK